MECDLPYVSKGGRCDELCDLVSIFILLACLYVARELVFFTVGDTKDGVAFWKRLL